MAKHESTAVNEMLERLATMKPLPPDPSDDLMFSPVRPSLAETAEWRLEEREEETGEALDPRAPSPRRNRSAAGTPAGAVTTKGGGRLQPPPVMPSPSPAGTMRGLGPVVQRAMAAAPPLPQRHVRPSPRSMPVAAPFESGAMEAAASLARAQPAVMAAGSASHAADPAFVEASRPGRVWIDEVDEVEAGRAHDERAQRGEAWSGTLVLHRRRTRSFARKLIAPMIGLAAAGAIVAGYVAYEGQAGSRAASARQAPAVTAAAPMLAPAPEAAAPMLAPAPAAAAPMLSPAPAAAAPAPAPAAASALAPAAAASAPAAAPSAFVDVMILSSPAGATVTLVDRGQTSFIGTTPVSTALDPSRRYELVFSHPSAPTRVEPIDPSATRRVDVSLGPSVAAPAVEPAVAPAAEPAAIPKAPRAEAVARVEQAADAPAAPRVRKAAAGPTGEGVLMISSKPPCEILLNGKPTGLMTPQRQMLLPPGSYKITLVNKAEDINKTLAVQISAEQPTKVIENLMK